MAPMGAVLQKDEPHRVIGARAGSPLIGRGPERKLPGQRRHGPWPTGVTDQIVLPGRGDVVDPQLSLKYWVVDSATSR